MSVYLLYKLREFGKMGFSGFEGRHYSLFENFEEDMGRAADLQTLITALSYKYMAQGIDHGQIPDSPSLESERRQIFFGAAIGIPTFFVKKDTTNIFLNRILKKTDKVRSSQRYPGYLRVHNLEYRKALLAMIREDGADLVELLDLGATLKDLEQRIDEPELYSAGGRLNAGILRELNASSPMSLDAREFNTGAERYYRTTLRQRHLVEAYGFLGDACRKHFQDRSGMDQPVRKALAFTLQGQGSALFLERIKKGVLAEQADIPTLQKLMNLVLLTVHCEEIRTRDESTSKRSHENYATPIHRAG
jgi:hypothetical protein